MENFALKQANGIFSLKPVSKHKYLNKNLKNSKLNTHN